MKLIYLDLYCQNIILFLGCTREECETALEKFLGYRVDFDPTNIEGSADTFKHTVVMYLRTTEKTTFNLGTIVHECDHAANQIFKIRGIVLDVDNDEPHAYLVDWIFRQILGAIDEHDAERRREGAEAEPKT